MTILRDFEVFTGVHCETTTAGNLLQHAGLPLSEPMLFGLGEGLGFGVFDFKNMPTPFFAGRSKGEQVTVKLAENLGLKLEYRSTRSKKKAWHNVASFIDAGQPVGVKLDAYFLDYFATKIHFAAHYVALIGYDDLQVQVVDTSQQGGLQATARDAFEEGRLWKGPMASNALTWTFSATDTDIDWPVALRAAIAANARSYLSPPIKNFGASGIRKAAALVPRWLQNKPDAEAMFAHMGMLMERAGTGGGLFRKMYAAFLDEANLQLQQPAVARAATRFTAASQHWTHVAALFESISAEHAIEAVQILQEIADIEEGAMRELAEI